ncbi:MAG: UDP-3-O-acyl-N-acetylglucosamine deacetylase [Pseudomonadales bacterium]|nr:UDP-3-O-acyl-N-acetylglucosamine deacetylase [Pseudomonadales bacterium]
MLRQRTIRDAVDAIGIGVHSASKVRMTLKPAPANSGVTFVRTDRKKPVRIPACVKNVCDTTLATSIGRKSNTVSTIEHLFSALWGVGIDNLIVELSGEEVPILDGSAAPFIYLIHRAGIVEQDAQKKFIRIRKPVTVNEGEATATLKPYAGFKAAYTFVANHPVYNRYPKHVEIDFSENSYVDDVSRARSFGLVKELEQAQTINRCQGSSLENAVGIDDYSVLNEEGLRYEDEFVKHKLLDLIGDLYLLGYPVIGSVEGYMSGHSLNNRLCRELLDKQEAWELITFEEPVDEVQEPAWSLDWSVSPRNLIPERIKSN